MRGRPSQPPDPRPHREAAPVVVVGGRAPEIGRRAREEELATLEGQRSQRAAETRSKRRMKSPPAISTDAAVVRVRSGRSGRRCPPLCPCFGGQIPFRRTKYAAGTRTGKGNCSRATSWPAGTSGAASSSAEGHVEKVFDAGLAAAADRRQIQGQRISAARCRTHARQPAGSGHGAIGQDLPRTHDVRQVGEGPPVLDRDLPGRHAPRAIATHRRHSHRLVHLLHLPRMRMQLPVSRNQSVHQEVPVIAHSRRTEVTPVRPVFAGHCSSVPLASPGRPSPR